MDFIKDINYSKSITVKDLIEQYDNSGLQASNLKKAAEIIVSVASYWSNCCAMNVATCY